MNTGRGFRIVRGVLLALFGVYFFLPLVSMANYSVRGKGPLEGEITFHYYAELVRNEDLRSAIISSLLLAVLTVVLMVVLLVPTMIWVRLRVPGVSRLVEFLCLLPLTVPPLVIVVGISNVYTRVNYLLGDSPHVLALAYVILVLPYSYRSIDSALRAIDVTTLAEAARSLGAGWLTVITRVVMPNIVSGVLGAAFIAIALVLGEYVFASLLHYDTMPVALAAIYKSETSTAIAGAFASIVLISLLLLALSYFNRHKSTDLAGVSE
ncbi:ABC transporter permease [Nocardioides sp. B-3]|uniref:ABC transporter permease n=1 Tax=Nocardioides sp. B-3 TaxID=2895565 RepID=UPI002152D846|nr:ABC transporter permease subunit [Nocardioides sp. B-3]UUZ57733.1 ABC transporter permease subunit [Nocardioides sp. B-3]